LQNPDLGFAYTDPDPDFLINHLERMPELQEMPLDIKLLFKNQNVNVANPVRVSFGKPDMGRHQSEKPDPFPNGSQNRAVDAQSGALEDR
jgi:hypothetical protein